MDPMSFLKFLMGPLLTSLMGLLDFQRKRKRIRIGVPIDGEGLSVNFRIWEKIPELGIIMD